MSRSTKYIFFFLLCSSVLLSGCICTAEATETMIITPDSPIDGVVLTSLSPTFNWSKSTSCDPNKYRLDIRESVHYGGDYWEDYVDYDNVPFDLSPYTLLPGRQYDWRVRANKDYVSSESPSASSAWSETATFFTGPVCSGETLVAPTLEYPRWGTYDENDEWITHDDLQEFHWSYSGGCLPISYDYQFATDAGFTDIVLSGTTTEDYVMSIYETFPNCSTLFWRVRANDGSSTGPWSDAFQFHWVRDDTECYQTYYISDDAARIHIKFYHDVCSQTGFSSFSTPITDPGCGTSTGPMIHGNGVKSVPPDFNFWGYEVDLGSGPCPSVGLDHLKSSELPIHVLAPGTYCVSISKSQTVYGGSVNLMSGIWTEPRTNEIVAEQTVEVPPLTSDVTLYFGWDAYDYSIPMPELPEAKNCRFCPDPIGPVIEIFPEEMIIPIYGRARDSAWKLSEAKGQLCYLFLPDEMLDEALAKMEGMELRSADLEFYPQPPPCPEPEKPDKPDKPVQQSSCSDYQDRASCLKNGCIWHLYAAQPGGYCAAE